MIVFLLFLLFYLWLPSWVCVNALWMFQVGIWRQGDRLLEQFYNCGTVSFIVRCFRDSVWRRECSAFCFRPLTCKCVLNRENFMQLQCRLWYITGILPQLEKILLIMASLKWGMKDNKSWSVGILKIKLSGKIKSTIYVPCKGFLIIMFYRVVS
jgi:hypothetical protein